LGSLFSFEGAGRTGISSGYYVKIQSKRLERRVSFVQTGF
jgi:hypothetical protein